MPARSSVAEAPHVKGAGARRCQADSKWAWRWGLAGGGTVKGRLASTRGGDLPFGAACAASAAPTGRDAGLGGELFDQHVTEAGVADQLGLARR